MCQDGVFDRAVSAIKAAKARGFAVNVNCTIFDGHPAEDIAAFFDYAKELGVGVSISPGYAYERAPDQQHFLARKKTKELFRDVFARGKGKGWEFMQSGLFLDFLAGNQEATTARRGACRRATCSAGRSPATCSAKAMPRPSRS